MSWNWKSVYCHFLGANAFPHTYHKPTVLHRLKTRELQKFCCQVRTFLLVRVETSFDNLGKPRKTLCTPPPRVVYISSSIANPFPSAGWFQTNKSLSILAFFCHGCVCVLTACSGSMYFQYVNTAKWGGKGTSSYPLGGVTQPALSKSSTASLSSGQMVCSITWE